MNIKSPVAGLSTLALTVALAGCGGTENASGTETSAAEAAPSSSGLVTPDLPTGPSKTIADFVAENKIIEAAVQQDDPGSPTIGFPLPPDWEPAGARKPDWAYGAIIYDKAKNPADPPFMTAIVNKLTGDVEADKILEYATGLLENLSGYQPDGEVDKTSLSGFDGIVFEGSYLQGDVRRHIAQLTVVIPGQRRCVVRAAAQCGRPGRGGTGRPRRRPGDPKRNHDHRLTAGTAGPAQLTDARRTCRAIARMRCASSGSIRRPS